MKRVFLAVVFPYASISVARAEDAEQLIRDGVALRRRGPEEAALAQFRRSYTIEPSAPALAQIGLVERGLAGDRAVGGGAVVVAAGDIPGTVFGVLRDPQLIYGRGLVN
jgi:hypothetical protein